MPRENVSSEKRPRDRTLRSTDIERSEERKGNLKGDPGRTEVGRKQSRAVVSKGPGGKHGLRGAQSNGQTQTIILKLKERKHWKLAREDSLEKWL